MARVYSTKEPVRLPLEEKGQVRAYYVMPPSLYSAAKIDRAVRARGAALTTPGDVLNALADGIRAILPQASDAAQREEQLGIVEDFRAWWDAEDDEERQKARRDKAHPVHQLAAAVRPHWPPLAQAEADRDFYWQVFGIEGCRELLHGYEGSEDPEGTVNAYRRGRLGLDDETLEEIPERHRISLGLAIQGMLLLSASAEKNSESPSPGKCAPGTSSSTTAKTPARSGRSKTPGRSRKSASPS